MRKPLPFDPLAVVANAVEAGRAILQVYATAFAVETKADQSPVTEGDLAANRIIVPFLESLGAGPVISEEGQQPPYETRRGWPSFWLVDPLDGTREFVNRTGQFTVNIGWIRNGRPAFGVVHAPVPDETFWGGDGVKPMRRDASGERRLPARRPRRKPGHLLVVGSSSHGREQFDAWAAEQRKEYPHLQVVTMGSSLKICLVAAGEADVYPRFSRTWEWDTAAADAVVRAAGRDLIDMRTGELLAYNKESLENGPFVVR